MKLHKRLASALVATMVLTSMPVATMANDYDSHWASEAITKWTNKKVVEGFEDGSFRPSETITKAQFAKILVELMGYNTTEGSSTYTDVDEDKWYSDYVTKISAADVMHQTGSTFSPNSGITREEAAYALVNAYKLENNGTEKASFTDETAIADWALENVKTLYNAGFIKGNPDGSFNPKGTLTRAELITMIDRMNSDVVNTKGDYSNNVTGNLVVNTTGVTLKDMTIDGDLYLAEGIGKGDVKMENVTVNGRVIVEGGGVNSIRADRKCKFNSAFLVYAKHPVRIIIEGDKIDLYAAADTEVILTGKYDEIRVGAGAKVILDDATVDTITINEAGKAPVIEIRSNSRVEKIVADVRATIQGNGKLVELVANATGISSSIKPDRTSGSEKPSVSNTSNNGWNSGFNDYDEDDSSSSNNQGTDDQKVNYTVNVVNDVNYTGDIKLSNGQVVTTGMTLSLTPAEARALTATVDTGFKATVSVSGTTITVTVTEAQTPDDQTKEYTVDVVNDVNYTGDIKLSNGQVVKGGEKLQLTEAEAKALTATVDTGFKASVSVNGTTITVTVELDNEDNKPGLTYQVSGTVRVGTKEENEAATSAVINVVEKETNAAVDAENITFADGTFTVVNLETGKTYVITATQNGKTSDPVEVTTTAADIELLIPGEAPVDPSELVEYTVTATGDFEEGKLMFKGQPVVNGKITALPADVVEKNFTVEGYKVVEGSFEVTTDKETKTGTVKIAFEKVETVPYTITNNGVTTNGVIKVKFNGTEYDVTDGQAELPVAIADANAEDVKVLVDGREFEVKTLNVENQEIIFEYVDFQYTLTPDTNSDALPPEATIEVQIGEGKKQEVTGGVLILDAEIPAGTEVKVFVNDVECKATVNERVINYTYVAPKTDTLTITDVTVSYSAQDEQDTIKDFLSTGGTRAKALKINGIESRFDDTQEDLVCDTTVTEGKVNAELTYKLPGGGTVTFVAENVPVSGNSITLNFKQIRTDVTGTVSYKLGEEVKDLTTAKTFDLKVNGVAQNENVEGTVFTLKNQTVDLTKVDNKVEATLDVTFEDTTFGIDRTAKFTTSNAKFDFDASNGEVKYIIDGAKVLAFDPTTVDAEGNATNTTTLTETNLYGTLHIEDKDGSNALKDTDKVSLLKGTVGPHVKLVPGANGVINYMAEESVPFNSLNGYKLIVEGPDGSDFAEGAHDVTIALNNTDLTEAMSNLSVNSGRLDLETLSPQLDDIELTSSDWTKLDDAVEAALAGSGVTIDKMNDVEYGALTSPEPYSVSRTSGGAVQVTTTTPGTITVKVSDTQKTSKGLPAPTHLNGAFAQIVDPTKYTMSITFRVGESTTRQEIKVYVIVFPQGKGFQFSAI